MKPSDHPPWVPTDLQIGLTCLALFFVIIGAGAAVRAYVVATPNPEPSALSLEPTRTLTVRDGYDPIVTWDPKDKRLTIHGEHVAADVLVCMGGQCGLVQDWVAR
jgi:hypothetical protein